MKLTIKTVRPNIKFCIKSCGFNLDSVFFPFVGPLSGFDNQPIALLFAVLVLCMNIKIKIFNRNFSGRDTFDDVWSSASLQPTSCFRNVHFLEDIYPSLVDHAFYDFSGTDVFTFMQHKPDLRFNKIKPVIDYKTGRYCRRYKLTAKQKAILSCFALSENDVDEFAKYISSSYKSWKVKVKNNSSDYGVSPLGIDHAD